MLARYKIYRGKRLPSDPLPDGIRQDTRWRTKHILRPTQELVEGFLSMTSDKAWSRYVPHYIALLESRFKEDRRPFDSLAELAMRENVYIGYSCPTKKNPTHGHCHTYLALAFMNRKYPLLRTKRES